MNEQSPSISQDHDPWKNYYLTLCFYKFIALAPKTPAKAEATAITTFRIISHTDFFIAIIYLLSVL